MKRSLGGARTLLHRRVTSYASRGSGGSNMFMHAGLRPLWPVIAFVPWLILGVGLLLHAAAQRLRQPSALRSRSNQLPVIAVLGLGLLVARVVMADSPAPESRACEVGTAPESASLADRLYAKGEYQ